MSDAMIRLDELKQALNDVRAPTMHDAGYIMKVPIFPKHPTYDRLKDSKAVTTMTIPFVRVKGVRFSNGDADWVEWVVLL